MSGDRGYDLAIDRCLELLRTVGVVGISKSDLASSLGYTDSTVSRVLPMLARDHGVGFVFSPDAGCRVYFAEGCKPDPQPRPRRKKQDSPVQPQSVPKNVGTHTAWMLANNWPPGWRSAA
jgi:hypothetical protein